MTDHQYPSFESGQSLTAADLNMLRAFLHERDRLVGRMIGFGVNCGLGGVVSGTDLTIQPGLAVDQYGEPLVLAASPTTPISLPPPAMTPTYDFIDTAPGGFSVVLEATDTVDPAPDCGETDCAGHADLHTTGVTLRTVAGRLTGTWMDFAGDDLLEVQPIRLELDSTPKDSFEDLRDAIATRLTNGTDPLVTPALISALQSRSLATSDVAGVKAYKCGWLNMVLFATLDLLRCEALMKLACDRSTTRPGVVLGWVHLDGATWVFDCSYRHAWEPPRGFTEAFLGGTCADPCGKYREAVEALLTGYSPPVPPPSGGGTVDPPPKCPKGSILIKGRCVNIYYPPPTFPDRWSDPWIELDPLGPIWNPPVDELWREPWIIYESEPWNVFDDGVIGVSDYVGLPADDVQGVLDDFISEGRGVPDVRVVGLGEAELIPGYLPSGGFSPSDTVVLTEVGGVVVATGRVAAVRNTRNVGTALPAALAAATDAVAAAEELRDMTADVGGRFDALDGELGGLRTDLGTLRHDFDGYKGGEFDQGGFGARLGAVERDLMGIGDFVDRVSVLEGKLDVLSKLPGGAPEVKGLDVEFGRGLVEFAETTVSAMKTLSDSVENTNFNRYTAAAERSQAELEIALATNDPEVIGRSTLQLLGTMRTMVKASGVEADAGRQLDAQLRQLNGLFG